MVDLIDNFLNNITMYRLVLYILIFLLLIAIIFSSLGFLSFSPINLLMSTLFLVAVCWITNTIFGKVFETPTNLESVYITSLILALIISPTLAVSNFGFLTWVAILSIASKYILAINKKHIFNPVALGVFITALTLGYSAVWWVGNVYMLLPVLLGGFLIIRKIKRFDLILSFIITSLFVTFIYSFIKGSDLKVIFEHAIISSPLFFFATVMLSEPLTTPPTRNLRIYYGVLVGLLFAPQFHIGSLFFTPEQGLLIGNIFSYLISPKQKLILKLKERIQLSPDIYDFIFSSNQTLNFLPGQYLEWTMGLKNIDSRGSRRYFTIASSPTENELRIGVKFNNPSSSFKTSLLSVDSNTKILASQLSGDFTLPKDKSKKLVFIAGGIGITPFRSMLKYLTDKEEKRDIILFYSNRHLEDIIYKDIFDDSQKKFGTKIIYTLTDKDNLPKNWLGRVGYIDKSMLETEVPDYKERTFYLSGPHSLVSSFEKVLSELGIPKTQIVIDYFPGFA